jgi:hypothetical protein
MAKGFDGFLPKEEDIEKYKLLRDMLKAQKQELDLLCKKKSDEQLNLMKIKMVNRVLEPLNDLFKNEPSHKFLDILNKDEMPTNSDVVLIISQYETAIDEFEHRYYTKDEYQSSSYGGTTRWMTEEQPPNYFKDKV